MTVATARAHPNIALIKYWGKRDRGLNLPAVPSLSVTLDRFVTETTVTWGARRDQVEIDHVAVEGRSAQRVLEHLDRIDDHRPPVRVVSASNFPAAAGLASSASAFAALTLAACAAAGQQRSLTELSVLARQGSGSACRSLWGGWVTWARGEQADGSDSHGAPLAPPGHWDLRVVVAVVSDGRKPVGSTAGMVRTERTSPLFPGFVQAAQERLDRARRAVLARDLDALGEQMERSTYEMHATMISAWPPVRYWQPGTVATLAAIDQLRAAGTLAFCTMDAGPNVKVLCRAEDAEQVAAAVRPHVLRVETLAIGGEPAVVVRS